MDIMLGALLISVTTIISVIGGFYCLSQDIERIVDQAVKELNSKESK